MNDKDYNPDANTCQNCGTEQGLSLEDLEKGSSELLGYTGDDYDGRDTYMQMSTGEREKNHEDGPTVLCLECYEAGHDTYWRTMHLEY